VGPEIKLSLPTITEDYSSYIIYNYFKGLSSNSADFHQKIYFPLMLEMGFADYPKYEVYENKYYEQHNQA